MGTAQITIFGQNKEELKIRALCDNGSQVNLITLSAVERINGKPQFKQTNFCGVGGKSVGISLGEIWLKIRLINGKIINNKFYVVKKITNYNPKEPKNEWIKLQGYLADENFSKSGKINALLGVSIWIQIIEPEILRSEDKLSIAQKTKLGYVIFENEDDPYLKVTPYIGSVKKGVPIKRLTEIIQRLWQIEEVPEISKKTREQEICEEIFVNQHSRDNSGRYIVRIPFEETKLRMLGKSKQMALKQFFTMENRMKKSEEFATKYKLFMSEYETLGHMEQIWEREESGYYTPHHGVLSANKFRVVFNASAKTSTGMSLNEAQLVGERLQRDLFLILINFRKFKYGIIADIEKMFRQVLIHHKDRKYQKIFWRENEHEPVKIYQLKTVTYGHACAPHCAVRALIQCAEDHKQEFPRAAKMVKENYFVDDLLTGAGTVQQVNEIKIEMTSLLSKGGFHITKWRSNGEIQGIIELKDAEEPSVLGLFWNLGTDKFFYKIKDNNEKETIWTKRKILSRIGKLYDPNGFLGPVVMKGKIIIQDLWRDQRDWDEKITGKIHIDWEKFNNDLKNIHMISIDRWFGTKEDIQLQLHGFCDASEKGFGAVIYSRIRLGNKYKTELVVAKSRVAPLKAVTIPRLELCAAELLAKLFQTILPIFKENRKIQNFCWSDSQVVLHWLKKPSISLKTFVAHRIERIQTITEKCRLQWNWIQGEENPADLISRGTTILELKNETKWWKGPIWLYEINLQWPIQPTFSENEASKVQHLSEIEKEMKMIHFVMKKTNNRLIRGIWYKFNKNKQKPFYLLESFGNWKKLVNVTAMIFRTVHNFKNPTQKIIGNISEEEENQAINYLIREDQNIMFPAEIKAAKENNREVLANLALIWDPQFKFLRIDGRVQSENVTRDEQFPILLDKKGEIAKLLIRDAHLKNGHGATQLILQYLRKKYWIIGARSLIKNIIKMCPICFRLRMKTSEQIMASLPNIRTTPAEPFSKTGIDYAGPILYRTHLGRNPKVVKAWIAVFVCLVTRAIHLELVCDASTDTFIAALRRFIARRGRVTELISDNGTNFVGANNYLKSIYSQIEKDKSTIENECHIKWTFITPSAPHHGGIYEAAVKSVKYHLTRIIGNTSLTYDEYDTILCQTEALVNSRPLCALTDDPTNLNALTPGHFLLLRQPVALPDEQDFRPVAENRLTRWNHIQKMLQHFWDRWYAEYLSTLINRPKWINQGKNLKVGDIVIVKEDNVPPLRWKLGRIQEVRLSGQDKNVRTVIVRTKTGVYKRPITKIGLLLENQEE